MPKKKIKKTPDSNWERVVVKQGSNDDCPAILIAFIAIVVIVGFCFYTFSGPSKPDSMSCYKISNSYVDVVMIWEQLEYGVVVLDQEYNHHYRTYAELENSYVRVDCEFFNNAI